MDGKGARLGQTGGSAGRCRRNRPIDQGPRLKAWADRVLAILRPQLPTIKSTQPILEATKTDHHKALQRADRLLALIEDFRAMDQEVSDHRRHR